MTINGAGVGEGKQCSIAVGQELAEIKEIAQRMLYNLEATGSVAHSLKLLTEQIATVVQEHRNSIPIRMVYLMFLLVLGLVFGVATIKELVRGAFIFQ